MQDQEIPDIQDIPEELNRIMDDAFEKHRKLVSARYSEAVWNLRHFIEETHPELDKESIDSIENGTYKGFKVHTT